MGFSMILVYYVYSSVFYILEKYSKVTKLHIAQVGLKDPRCDRYPCIDAADEQGYGLATWRGWQGIQQKARPFITDTFETYAPGWRDLICLRELAYPLYPFIIYDM